MLPRRRLFTFFAACSLLLGVVCCAAWGASYRAAWYWGAEADVAAYRPMAGVDRGRVYVARPDDDILPASARQAGLHAAEPGTLAALWGAGGATLRGERMFYHCRAADVRVHYAAVPIGAAATPCLVLPIVWMVGRRRAATRMRAGRCAACGYDLRATPGRCPECGREQDERRTSNAQRPTSNAGIGGARAS